MKRLYRALAALTALGWATLACFVVLTPAAGAATAHAVNMSGYAFAPSSITVHVGDSISWTNHDQAPHNVLTTSAPVSIDGPMLSKGQSWSYTFTTPGTYHYICEVHPDMHATVVVLAAATMPSASPKTTAVAKATHHASTAPKSTPTMTGMTSTHAKSPVHASSSAAPAGAAPASNPPASTAAGAAQVSQTSGVTSARVKPLLLIAGVIAALTVFCLLALASRPSTSTD